MEWRAAYNSVILDRIEQYYAETLDAYCALGYPAIAEILDAGQLDADGDERRALFQVFNYQCAHERALRVALEQYWPSGDHVLVLDLGCGASTGAFSVCGHLDSVGALTNLCYFGLDAHDFVRVLAAEMMCEGHLERVEQAAFSGDLAALLSSASSCDADELLVLAGYFFRQESLTDEAIASLAAGLSDFIAQFHRASLVVADARISDPSSRLGGFVRELRELGRTVSYTRHVNVLMERPDPARPTRGRTHITRMPDYPNVEVRVLTLT